MYMVYKWCVYVCVCMDGWILFTEAWGIFRGPTAPLLSPLHCTHVCLVYAVCSHS